MTSEKGKIEFPELPEGMQADFYYVSAIGTYVAVVVGKESITCFEWDGSTTFKSEWTYRRVNDL